MAISELPAIFYGRASRILRRLARSLLKRATRCVLWSGNRVLVENYEFLSVLYCYLILLTAIFSGILYAIGGLAYVDALFLATGATTQTSLATVHPETLRLSQQILLLIASILSNLYFVDVSAALARLYWFEKRFQHLAMEVRNLRSDSRSRSDALFPDPPRVVEDDESPAQLGKRKEGTALMVARISAGVTHEITGSDEGATAISASSVVEHTSDRTPSETFVVSRNPGEPSDAIKWHVESDEEKTTRPQGDANLSPKAASRHPIFNLPEEFHGSTRHRDTRMISSPLTFSDPELHATASARAGPMSRDDSVPYLSFQPELGRNAFYSNLTEEQREELGDLMYRSLKALSLITFCSYVALLAVGVVGLAPWVSVAQNGQKLPQGVNKAWWATFTVISALNDYGLVLGIDSLQPINHAIWPFILLSLLTFSGGFGMPVVLRSLIWMINKCVRQGSGFWEETKFVLDLPRAVSITLLPSKVARLMAGFLLALVLVSTLLYDTLNIGNPALGNVGAAGRVRAGIFQTLASSSAGMYFIPITQAAVGMQVWYLCLMWLRAPMAGLPYSPPEREEPQLGVYSGAYIPDRTRKRRDPDSFVAVAYRASRLISNDLGRHVPVVFLASIIIVSIERSPRKTVIAPEMTMFGIVFEIVSALCNVGFSLCSSPAASLSARFSTVSKVVIIIVEMVGKHRVLPRTLNKQIVLPSDEVDTESLGVPRRAPSPKDGNRSIEESDI